MMEGEERGLIRGRDMGLVEGREVGLIEGEERGLVKGAIRIARSLLEKGMAEAEIAEVTGLTPEEVAALGQEM